MSTHVIVGANRGIGLELAKQLHAKEDQKVIATCRKSSEGLNATGAEVHEGVDVTSDEAVAAFAAKMKGRELDGLIVNAGVLERNTLAHLDFDSIRKQLEVNALGPLRVVAALRDALEDGAKGAIITSRMGSIADNGSGGSYGYRMSKTAVNAAGVSLARDLAPRRIAVGLFHPGYVRTDMTGGNGNVDPDEAAAMLLDRYADLDMDHTGVFWHANGEELPW